MNTLTLRYVKQEDTNVYTHTHTHSQTHPPIILLEGVSECETIEKILVAAEAVPKKPYIIATLCSGSAKGIPLHQLLFHHPIRLAATAMSYLTLSPLVSLHLVLYLVFVSHYFSCLSCKLPLSTFIYSCVDND